MTPPDKISEAINNAKECLVQCKRLKNAGKHYDRFFDKTLPVLMEYIEIQAATTPAAVVTVDELIDTAEDAMYETEFYNIPWRLFRLSLNAIAKKYAGRAIIITADKKKE